METQVTKDRLLEVAKLYTTSKFIMWIEENHIPKDNKRLDIEILNRDEIFNLNMDTVKIRVNERVFVFTNGVFQNVLDFQATLNS